MAMMEHWCLRCGWGAFDNDPHTPPSCPQCGSDEVRSQADEAYRDDGQGSTFGPYDDRDEPDEEETCDD